MLLVILTIMQAGDMQSLSIARYVYDQNWSSLSNTLQPHSPGSSWSHQRRFHNRRNPNQNPYLKRRNPWSQALQDGGPTKTNVAWNWSSNIMCKIFKAPLLPRIAFTRPWRSHQTTTTMDPFPTSGEYRERHY